MASQWLLYSETYFKKHLRKIALSEACKMIWNEPVWKRQDELTDCGNSSENSWVELQFPRPLGWSSIAEQESDELAGQLFEAERRGREHN